MISHRSIDFVSCCLLIHISDHVILPWRLHSDLQSSICIHASAHPGVHTFSIHIKEPVILSLTRDNQFKRFINNFTQDGGVGRIWRNHGDFNFNSSQNIKVKSYYYIKVSGIPSGNKLIKIGSLWLHVPSDMKTSIICNDYMIQQQQETLL